MSRATLAALAAGAVLTGCGAVAAAASAPGRPAARRIAVPGRISVAVPAGWHLRRPPITALSAPAERLLLTSGSAPRGGNCGPDAAERALPPHGALLFLFEYTGRDAARRTGFPPKPAHARLRRRDLATYECWRVPSYALRFRAAGRAFQLHVAFGPRAGARRRAQVLRAIDSLWISPNLPPVTAGALEHALRTNPNQEASAASCRRATRAERRRARRLFGPTRLALFSCSIAVRGAPAEPFVVQVLPNHCYVGVALHSRRGDMGCVIPAGRARARTSARRGPRRSSGAAPGR
jgi:hypothetical protein